MENSRETSRARKATDASPVVDGFRWVFTQVAGVFMAEVQQEHDNCGRKYFTLTGSKTEFATAEGRAFFVGQFDAAMFQDSINVLKGREA
jgi:hypothetical protein